MNTSKPQNTFLLTLRKYLTEEARRGLMLALVMIGVPALFGIWIGLFFGGSYGSLLFIYSFLELVAWMLIISRSFAELKTTQGRISLLMTPTRAIDLFLVRILTMTFVSVALYFAGWLALCGCNILCRGICYSNWSVPALFDYDGLFSDPISSLTLAAICLFGAASYLLGAIEWPKWSFLKTSGFLMALNFLLSIVGVFFIRAFSRKALTLYPDALLWVIISIIFAADIALIVLAYFRLKRKTVI